jgi:hypothetical protein
MADKKQHADRELDAALAMYAAVEPRPGLEERVFANLRAERARVPHRAWWRWSAVVALAAVVLVALAVGSRTGKQPGPVLVNHPLVTTQVPKAPGTQVVSNGTENGVRPQSPGAAQRTRVHHPHVPIAMAANPKLGQFPSPEPLSEQEKILASYVAKYPEQAVLLARAASEAGQRDRLEEMQAFASGDQATDSEERNNNTSER